MAGMFTTGLAFTVLLMTIAHYLAKLFTNPGGEAAKLGLAAPGPDGGSIIMGIPVSMEIDHGHVMWWVDLLFTVNNPLGTRMLLCPKTLYNRPMGHLPPVVGNAPGWLSAAGLDLRAEPPEWMEKNMAALVFLKPFVEFAGRGALDIEARKNGLKIHLEAPQKFSDETLKQLVESGAKAAQAFN